MWMSAASIVNSARDRRRRVDHRRTHAARTRMSRSRHYPRRCRRRHRRVRLARAAGAPRWRRRRSWSRTWSQYIGRELGHRGGGGLGGAGGVPRRRLVCTGSRVVGRSGQDVLAGVVQRTLVFMGEAYRRLVVEKPVAVGVAEMKAAEGLYEG